MIIADVRTEYKTRTGDSNLTDAQIDRKINAAIKLLDKLTHFEHAPARYFEKLTAVGTHIVQLTAACRQIDSVWIIELGEGRTRLEKVNYDWLRAEYSDFTDITNDTPVYYALAVNRDTEGFNPADASLVDYAAYIDTVDADKSSRAIEIMPPIDKEYLLEVHGKFYSHTLSDSHTENWWTLNYLELVLNAALYLYEIDLRNTEGANDYLRMVKLEVDELSKDTAEEATVDATVMEG